MGANKAVYDVIVIGAGVVGSGIIRELSKYRLKIALLEKKSDVGEGTSKGNSAIMHTGFDAKVGTLEARLVREGSRLFRNEVAPALNIPIEEAGAVLVARNEDEYRELPKIIEIANKNEITDVKILSVEEVYRLEPHVVDGVKGGVFVPKESITCPFTTPLAYATQAVVNGAHFSPNTEVKAIGRDANGITELDTTNGKWFCRYLINSAGLHSDKVDAFLGYQDFRVIPRRGEFIVYDKFAKRLVSHILLQVPTPKTKGILICPPIFGNVLLGPTADDHNDVEDNPPTSVGLEKIQTAGKKLLPALFEEQDITTTYAANRSATQYSEYQLFFHPEKNYVTVGGIRSTGLSAALAIARHVVNGLRDMKLELSEKADFKGIRMPSIGECACRPYQDPELIRKNAGYGKLVCYCEKVSEQELKDAVSATIPAKNLGAVKRRTRATMGRCQGFNCMPSVMKIIADSQGKTVKELFEGGV